MTADREPTKTRRKKSLRLNLVVSLLGLALLPLVIELVALFLVVRIDVAEIERLQSASRIYEYLDSVLSQVAVILVASGMLACALAWRTAHRFLQPILGLRRGAEIISRINQEHRIVLDTGDELEELAHEINLMAENLAQAHCELAERIQEATLAIQEERNRLSTVFRTMADGVVVANDRSEIILMNPRARIILERGYSSGIGAPLARFFPRDRLDYHLQRLRLRWGEGLETVEEVVFPLPNGQLLKGSMSAVSGPGAERAGFLLVFRDLSAPGAVEKRLEKTLREMPLLLRGPVATSRSLVDALQRHREMPAEKRQAFLAAVSEEMMRLSDRVTAVEEAGAAAQTSRWPAISSHPGEMLQESVRLVPGIPVVMESDGSPVPTVLVEPFTWVASLRCVLQWLELKNPGKLPIGARLRREDGAVVTTFTVQVPLVGDLSELESLELSPADEERLLLGEAVRRNRGELWTRSTGGLLEVSLALLQANTVDEGRSVDGAIEGEPSYYDFDLFLPRPSIEREDQLRASLTELEYVVFDTETTGLRLSQGDRVISISGVRIRRGRIVSAETFHTFVNPGRPIPPESSKVHHIEDHMVATSPSMNQVYPKFVEFVGDSILVAHNAAFDKRCLDLAAAEAGLPRMDNPILDTLFLSYALHNDIEGHTLDAIAKRLGIVIEGRHSSMGDAQATAEIFLALQSLLAGRGVITLAEAKGFCDRQLLLRWQSSRF